MQGPGILLLMTAGLLGGCMASAGDREANAPAAALHIEFSVEDTAGRRAATFHEGDSVQFVFRVHNAATAPRTLAFTFPPHRVRVVSAAGTPVWQAFEGRMFPQVMRTQDVPAGESVTFTAEWEVRGLAPGAYRVQPEFIGFVEPGGRLEENLPAVTIHIQ